MSLTSTGPGGSDPETKTDYISVAELPPVADFSGLPTSGLEPLLDLRTTRRVERSAHLEVWGPQP